MIHHADTTTDTRRRAFTLTELLIVVTIVIILISILLPAIGGVRNAARRSSSESLMASIHQSVGQFRAAEQRLPGYFTVRDVGSVGNFVTPTSGGIRGLTYAENALIDLAGGVYEDQDASAADNPNDPDVPPDIIRVGVGNSIVTSESLEVNIQRTAVGDESGPGYIDLPEGFVASDYADGRAGTFTGHRWMPRIVDAWGTPILMWPRDEFAGKDKPLVAEAADTSVRAAFYWGGNSAFTCSKSIGRSKVNNWDSSVLSYKSASADQERVNSLNAIVGHPQFPDPASINGPNGPLPAEARGDVVLHSAGANGVYLESDDAQFDEYHYIPDGTDFSSSPSWITDTTNYLDKADDVILAGS